MGKETKVIRLVSKKGEEAQSTVLISLSGNGGGTNKVD